MSRSSAIARLAAAYGVHQVRRLRRRRPARDATDVLETYARDRLLPIDDAERSVLAAASRCVNCGLCGLVVARTGRVRPPDLAASYLRDYPVLAAVAAELGSHVLTPEESSLLNEAAAACPVGVPLEAVLEMARRLASA